MTAPPLLLLDVDGVLNALSDDGDPQTWPEWRLGRATADGVAWPIRWAPAVVERLCAWHERGVVELQWLTTWGHDANLELRALLGMPALEVAGTYDDEPFAGTPDHEGAAAHAAVAPSAPDELTGRWWKHDVVRRLLQQHPGRLVIWVDDELHRDNDFRRWAEEHSDVVPVGPDPATGLAPGDLDQIATAVDAG